MSTDPSEDPQPVGGFYLRQEEKPFEQRSALTPATVETLVRAGFKVFIERNPTDRLTYPEDIYPGRIFDDKEFEE